MNYNNTWVGYLDRTYEQIRDNAITKMAVYVPEITDHTESNPYIIEVGVWSGMTEHLNYYIDNTARETFLATARQYESMVKIARFSDYRLRGVRSATVDLTFTLSEPLQTSFSIPTDTIVSSEDGVQFVVTAGGIIEAGETSITVPASQMELVVDANIGVSNGTEDQNFKLVENVEDTSITISINNTSWSYTKDLTKHSGVDNVYATSLNTDGIMEVSFGDGIFGAIPPSGSTIYASYGVSIGTGGNLAENSLKTIDSNLSNPAPATLTVTNINRSSGGADIETLEELRRTIPKHNRTNNRAVTKEDYEDIAELNAGVRSASAQFTCGKTVDVYVFPKGGGVASQSLLDSVRDDFYDETRMITTKVRVLPAGEIMLFVEWDITVLPSFSKSSVEQAVRNSLMTYINDTNLGMYNSTEIGNVYELIESIKGVDFSKLIKFYVKPYARITSGTNELVWERDLNPTSTDVITWTFKYSASGEVELLREGAYYGTYPIGQQVTLQEITFKIIDAGYQTGDSWQFVTYPYSDSVTLAEPSILVLTNDNLKLNMYGGI